MRRLGNVAASTFAFLILGTCALADPLTDDAYQQAIAAGVTSDANQDLAPATLSYLDALHLEPSTDTPRVNLFRMITNHGMPHRFTAAQLQTLRKNSAPFEIKTVDNGLIIVTLPGASDTSLDSLVDPQNSWPFPALSAVYAPSQDGSGSVLLVCTVHYQTTDDRDFAEHTGRLLALLKSVLERRTGRMPEYENAFNVWLSRSTSTTPGGEQWRNNIYLYDIGDQRSSIEWIREIAHEYGHLAIPPMGGDYTAPEAWANGYVGERLLVRWLADPKLAGASAVEKAWGRTFGGYTNFKAKLIDPETQLFLANGLDKVWLSRKDSIGMNYLIGLTLWVDETKGGKALGSLLWDDDSSDPSSLFAPAKALGVPGSQAQLLTHKPHVQERAS